jgi:hypothetical protein
MSNPTNIKGTMTNTMATPLMPPTKSGSRFEIEPVTPEPVTKKKPTTRIAITTVVWTIGNDLDAPVYSAWS